VSPHWLNDASLAQAPDEKQEQANTKPKGARITTHKGKNSEKRQHRTVFAVNRLFEENNESEICVVNNSDAPQSPDRLHAHPQKMCAAQRAMALCVLSMRSPSSRSVAATFVRINVMASSSV